MFSQSSNLFLPDFKFERNDQRSSYNCGPLPSYIDASFSTGMGRLEVEDIAKPPSTSSTLANVFASRESSERPKQLNRVLAQPQILADRLNYFEPCLIVN